jgi:hypothetical protein
MQTSGGRIIATSSNVVAISNSLINPRFNITRMYPSNEVVSNLRETTRLLVRELGFMSSTLAGLELPAVYAITEIGHSTSTTASSLRKSLNLDQPNVGQILAK